ncbi:MAG: hypothetical protein H7249_02845 [Chitinophagaceae bacterium]|nr:hypothetical protein [Oligoflexus sp.]
MKLRIITLMILSASCNKPVKRMVPGDRAEGVAASTTASPVQGSVPASTGTPATLSAGIAELTGKWNGCDKYDKTDLSEPLPNSEMTTMTFSTDGNAVLIVTDFSDDACKVLYPQSAADQSIAAALKILINKGASETSSEYIKYKTDITQYMNSAVAGVTTKLTFKANQTAAGHGEIDLTNDGFTSYGSYKITTDGLSLSKVCNSESSDAEKASECKTGRGSTFADAPLKKQ